MTPTESYLRMHTKGVFLVTLRPLNLVLRFDSECADASVPATFNSSIVFYMHPCELRERLPVRE